MLVMLVLLENEEFCESSVIFLTIYAVVCSNVVSYGPLTNGLLQQAFCFDFEAGNISSVAIC